MKYFLIILLTVVLGASCGYFQYWMAARLNQKRWLLLLQPVLLLAAAVCFLTGSLRVKRLYDSPTWPEWAPFCVLLACSLAGWAAAAVRKRKRDD